MADYTQNTTQYERFNSDGTKKTENGRKESQEKGNPRRGF